MCNALHGKSVIALGGLGSFHSIPQNPATTGLLSLGAGDGRTDDPGVLLLRSLEVGCC